MYIAHFLAQVGCTIFNQVHINEGFAAINSIKVGDIDHTGDIAGFNNFNSLLYS
jgi:hypothetical protein